MERYFQVKIGHFRWANPLSSGEPKTTVLFPRKSKMATLSLCYQQGILNVERKRVNRKHVEMLSKTPDLSTTSPPFGNTFLYETNIFSIFEVKPRVS